MLRDMMPLFDLYQPDTLDNALDLADRLGPEGWLVAGGQDSWDWLKNRTRRTRAVVDLSGIAELKGVRETDGGIQIGGVLRANRMRNQSARTCWAERAALLLRMVRRRVAVSSARLRSASSSVCGTLPPLP